MSVKKVLGPLICGVYCCMGYPVLAQAEPVVPETRSVLQNRLSSPLSFPSIRSASLVAFARLALVGTAQIGPTTDPVPTVKPTQLAATVPAKVQAVAPKKVCLLALQAQAENPVANQPLIGRVYSVIGNTVLVQLDDGRLIHVTRSWAERGYLGQLVGRRVALTDIYCSRITLAPPPPPVIPAAIAVPALEFGPRVIPVPPVTPRMPYQRPAELAPQSAPAVIPQTW